MAELANSEKKDASRANSLDVGFVRADRVEPSFRGAEHIGGSTFDVKKGDSK
jgi:hypothetical protein